MAAGMMAQMALSGAVGGPVAAAAIGSLPQVQGTLMGMCSGSVPEPAEEKSLNAPPPSDGPFYLRLCILSAADLAAGGVLGNSDPYVELHFNGQSYATSACSQTLNPVWDHLLEIEIPETGFMQIKVYDQNFGRQGTLLGITQLTIPKQTKRIKREVLQLTHVPAGWFSKPPNSRLTLIYHVTFVHCPDCDDSNIYDEWLLRTLKPDLVELSNRVMDSVEDASPTDYMAKITVFQSEHTTPPKDMLSCIKVTLGEKHATSPFGRPDGLVFHYGTPFQGWSTEFGLKQMGLEDLIQTRLTVEWLLRKGDEDELADVQLMFLDEAADVTKDTGDDINSSGNEVVKSMGQALMELADAEEMVLEEERKKREEEKNRDLADEDGNVVIDDSDLRKADEGKVHTEDDHDEHGRKQARVTGGDSAQSVKKKKAAEKDDRRRANAGKQTSEKKERLLVFGHWKLAIDEIRDFCKESQVCWAARAPLANKGIKGGEVLIQVDIHSTKESPHSAINLYKFPPPTVRGLESIAAPDASKSPKKAPAQTLYMYAFGDYMPVTDMNWNKNPWDNCDPFLTVNVQGLPDKPCQWTSPVKSGQQREIEWEPLAIRIPTSKRRQTIVVEVFDSDSPIAIAAALLKQLIGQIRLSTLQLNRPTWHHLYGGAVPSKREDIDTAMMKGAVGPASTYHGSICLLFDSKRSRKKGWPPFPDVVGTLMKLEVRLCRGLYLPDNYRDKEVNLLIQIAGCALDLTDAQGNKLKPGLDPTIGVRLKRKMKDIPASNADILSFPGRVNSKGVLRFYNWSLPRKQHQREVAKAERQRRRNREKGVMEEEDPADLEMEQNIWVQRTSQTLPILPNVDWAYCYLQLVGEELEPPKVFGRIPLTFPEGYVETVNIVGGPDIWPPAAALKKAQKREQGSTASHASGDPVRSRRSIGINITPTTETSADMLLRHPNMAKRGSVDDDELPPNDEQPVFIAPKAYSKWVKMFWDQSVVGLPTSRFPSDFAGALLGYARLLPSDSSSFPTSLEASGNALNAKGIDNNEVDLGAIQDSDLEVSETKAGSGSDKHSGSGRINRGRRQVRKRDIIHDEDLDPDNEPMIDDYGYVPEPDSQSALCGFDTTYAREGAPGSVVQYEALPSFLLEFDDMVSQPSAGSNASKLGLLGKKWRRKPKTGLYDIDEISEGGPDARDRELKKDALKEKISDLFKKGTLTAENRLENDSPFMKKIYLHADILQGRHLPALDEDALVNPWWEVWVEDQVVKMLQESDIEPDLSNLDNTLNPCFLNRTIVALDVYLPPSLDVIKLKMNEPEFETPPTAVSTSNLCLTPIQQMENGFIDPHNNVPLEALPPGASTDDLPSEAAAMVAKAGKMQWGCLDEFDDMEYPPPPVILRLYDIDKSTNGDGIEKQLIGTIVDWDPANLDQRYKRLPQKLFDDIPLNLNESQEVVWYSLADEEQVAFDVVETEVGRSNRWMQKARMLCAFGYSVHPGDANLEDLVYLATKHSKLKTRKLIEDGDLDPEGPPADIVWPVLEMSDEEVVQYAGTTMLYFRVLVDILGLRDKQEDLDGDHDYKLKLKSFWPDNAKRPLEFHVASEEFPGPNFTRRCDPPSKSGGAFEGSTFNQLEHAIKMALCEKGNKGSGAKVGSWVGQRIISPLFATPYFPYMQGSNLDITPTDAQASLGTLAKGKLRVVLPDITAALCNQENRDVATLSLPLNDWRKAPQGLRALKVQSKCSKLAKIPPSKINTPPNQFEIVKRLRCRTSNVTTIGVECYAQATGDLLYDNDLVVGRLVLDHDLFFIRNDDDTVKVHLFNGDDFFLGYPDKLHTPFMEPAFRVMNLGTPGPSAVEFLENLGIVGGRDAISALKKELEAKQKALALQRQEITVSVKKKTPKRSRSRCCSADENDVGVKKGKGESKSILKTLSTKKNEATQNAEQVLADNAELTKVDNLSKIVMDALEGDGASKDSKTKMDAALETWLRPRGHRIKFQIGCAGSRVLARLQLLQREYDAAANDEQSRRDSIKKHKFKYRATCNILTVVSQIEGVVVWSVSDLYGKKKQHMFTEAGTVLMVIQGDLDKAYYLVTMPTMDLRYPAESGFFVRDTITRVFNDLEKMSLEQEVKELEKLLKAKQNKARTKKQKKEKTQEDEDLQIDIAGKKAKLAALNEEDDRSTRSAVSQGSSVAIKIGYDEPIRVRKGDLVCRLRKIGYNSFDRNQSCIWYDNFDILPALNLYRDLAWGEDLKPIIKLKGWVNIQRVKADTTQSTRGAAPDPTNEILGLPQLEEDVLSVVSSIGPCSTLSGTGSTTGIRRKKLLPRVQAAPPMHGWIVQTVVVHVYVLTARNLENVDVIGKSDPYLKLIVGDNEEVSANVFQDDLDPNFYEHFAFPVLIPGEAHLRICVFDKGDFGDTKIGQVVIDLEERWLALKQLKPDPAIKDTPIQDCHGRNCFPPIRPFPIEYMPLTKGSGAEEQGVTTGSVRYFIDMHNESENYDVLPIDFMGRMVEFELRIILWKVTDISVFMGTGYRNDVKLELRLRTTDFFMVETEDVYVTDVHQFARETASFNWRITKKLTLPIASIQAKVSIVDQNVAFNSSLIYAPEVQPLDDFCRLQLNRYRQDVPLVKPLKYIVYFDEPMGEQFLEAWCQAFWCAPFEACGCSKKCTHCCGTREIDPDDEEEVTLCCCLNDRCCKRTPRRRKKRRRTMYPAKLHCTMDLVPAAEAEARPVGTPRAGPYDELPEPTDRPSPGLIFTDPLAYMQLVLGEQTVALIKCCCAGFCILIVLAIIVFIVAQIYMAFK